MQSTFKNIDEQRYKSLGVDLTLLWENLHRTPTERIQHHQEMLRVVEAVKGKANKNKSSRHSR